MPFSDHASSEAAALISRLVASQSERSGQQLRALRAALDAAVKACESGLAAAPALDDEIKALAKRLTAAAEAEIKATAERIHKDAKQAVDTARADADAARVQAENARKHAETLAKQADASNKVVEASRKQIEASRAEVETARKEAEALKKDTESARKQVEAAQKDVEAVRREMEAVRKDADNARKADAGTRAALEDELQEVRGLLDATLAESAELNKQRQTTIEEREKIAKELAVAQTQLQAAQTQRQSINALLKASNARVQTLERTTAETEKAMSELRAKFEAAANAESNARERGEKQSASARVEVGTLRDEVLAFGSLFESLVVAFQHLGEAPTIQDVLTGLVKQLGTQFSRVAVFRVKGNRLEGEHQSGFDSPKDITNVAIPMSIDSLLTRAAASGEIERLAGAELADSSRAPFGGNPSCAVALPIVVQDETLAIVYADDSGRAPSERAAGGIESRTAFAELLRRHTVALLMRLTTELKALAELREYATTLLNEVEHMFVSDVEAGRKDGELRNRLKDNVECARRIYAQRVVVEGPAAAPLLEERLAALIEAQHGTAFGKELSAVVGRVKEGKRRAAEAS